MSDVEVSVVIPVYNSEDCVDEFRWYTTGVNRNYRRICWAVVFTS